MEEKERKGLWVQCFIVLFEKWSAGTSADHRSCLRIAYCGLQTARHLIFVDTFDTHERPLNLPSVSLLPID